MRKAAKIIVYINYEADCISGDFEEIIIEQITTALETNSSVEAAQVEFDYEEE